MTSYIDHKNQTLLWSMIHKNPHINTVFPNDPYHLNMKNNWFKNMISQVYSTLPQNISNPLLLEKNKQTLLLMNNDLKQKIQNTTQINLSNEPIYSRNEKDSSINTQFEERQKEYELMTKKPLVEEISFKEELNDNVIKNMDELIQQQLREREKDLQNITKNYDSKMPSVTSSVSIGLPSKLSIQENIPKKELNVVNLSSVSEKKTVSWGNESIIEYNTILETKIEELNKKYDTLLEFLHDKLPNMMMDFSNRKIIETIVYENIEKIVFQNKKN
jgi:hypothetical protein